MRSLSDDEFKEKIQAFFKVVGDWDTLVAVVSDMDRIEYARFEKSLTCTNPPSY